MSSEESAKLDIEQARDALVQLQEQLLQRVERTHKHIFEKQSPVSPKFSDQVTEMENEELVHALDEEGREELVKINQALLRLEEGCYFTCIQCNKEINPERLQAIPFADKCIDCANSSE